MTQLPPLPDDQTVTVRYVRKEEAPGRPVRIDYGTIAHEYLTLADACDIRDRMIITDRCAEATGHDPAWPQVRDAYTQLSAVLIGLGRPGWPWPCNRDAFKRAITGCKVSDSDDGEEPITDEDFDLFPESMAMDVRPSCTCDTFVDDPCPVHAEENAAQDRRIAAANARYDAVHAPSHYTDGGIETIDYLRAKMSREAFVGFCQGNALKYLSRAGKKGSAAEDFAKAEVYCRWAKEAEQ